MKIDKKRMTFTEMTDEEAHELRRVVEDLVVRGEIDSIMRGWFDRWRKELGFDETQGLLLMTTAFAQRAALSLVEHLEDRVDWLENACEHDRRWRAPYADPIKKWKGNDK